MDYIDNGNIRNSVNFPACDMGVCQMASRVAVMHLNIPNMIGQVTGTLAAGNVNISDMTNKSRDKYAYTLLDRSILFLLSAEPDDCSAVWLLLSISVGAGGIGAFFLLPAAAKAAIARITMAAMIPAAQYFIFLFIIPFPPFLIGNLSMR